jgi:hypothetical protein
MKTTIKLTKKIILDENSSLTNAPEIRNRCIEFINRELGDNTSTYSIEDLRENGSKLIQTIENKLKTEVGYFITQIKYIPELNDTMKLVKFPQNGYSYNIINPDISKRDEYKVQIFFNSNELNLLRVIGDKLLLSKTIGDSDKTFLLKLDDSISISSYENDEK